MKTPKTKRTYQLNNNTIRQLKELAKLEKQSMAKIIEYAVDAYEQSKNDHKRRFMEVYHAIGKAEQLLEYKRDTNPKTGEYDLTGKSGNFLTKEEKEVYDFYGKTWDKMRSLPFFSEVEPIECEDDY